MNLKKSYQFLYMPDDHGATRHFRIPRWGILACCALVVFLGSVAVLYSMGIQTGNSWLPGGSRLQKENLELAGMVSNMGGRIDNLRTEMDNTLVARNLMATAISLPELDNDTYAAGIGGRGSLTDVAMEVPAALPGAELEGFAEMGSELDLLLRQARIQREGFSAMLDTLEVRSEVRQHIPSIRPLDIGWVSSRFGFRTDPFTDIQTFHRGLDFSVPSGTPVRVTGDGVVFAVQQQRGLGRVIKIDHGNGVMTVYAHLNKTLVAKGSKVKRGEIIAHSGNTGRSTAPHLHYEIRINDRPVNPISYILDSYATRN